MTVLDFGRMSQLLSTEAMLGRLTASVNILLLLLAAYAAAQLTWRLSADISAGAPPSQQAASAQPGDGDRASSGFDVNRLASYHLFGRADARPSAKPAPRAVQATRLPLTLRGVVASDNKVTARAIIASPNSGELPYAIGADLPGGAKLEEIHADKIILSRNGQLETLLLPKDTEGVSFAAMPAPPVAPPAGAAPESAITTPDEFRETLLSQPDDLNGLVNTIPQQDADGRLIGFQLQPGRDAGFLQRFGLQAGDVLTNVNGIALDSPLRALEVMRELGEADQVNIEILRDNQTQSLVFTFDQG